MTWKQRKPFDPTKPVIKTSPKQALQREWFVRQGQILGGFHCMHSVARQLELKNTAGQLLYIKEHMLQLNNEWFEQEKRRLNNAPK